MRKDKNNILRQHGTIKHDGEVYKVEYSLDIITGKVGLKVEGNKKLPPGSYEIKPE